MKLIFVLGTSLLLSATARADQKSDLEQVVQIASQGQNAQTAADVRQYANAHGDEISAILQGYHAYIQQIQAMTNEGIATPPPAASGSTGAAGAPAAPTTSSTLQARGTAGTAGTGEAKTGLQTSELQPSTGLVMSHLAGYPALPEGEPVSAITQPTAEQLQYAAEVQAQMQARKRELMGTPIPWP